MKLALASTAGWIQRLGIGLAGSCGDASNHPVGATNLLRRRAGAGLVRKVPVRALDVSTGVIGRNRG